MIDQRYNPQAVSAKAMQRLCLADREQVLFCQQAYVPLDGTLVNAIEKVERSDHDTVKVRARG